MLNESIKNGKVFAPVKSEGNSDATIPMDLVEDRRYTKASKKPKKG